MTSSGGFKTVNKQQVSTGDTLFLRVRIDSIDEKTLAARRCRSRAQDGEAGDDHPDGRLGGREDRLQPAAGNTPIRNSCATRTLQTS
jgi:hypothetical protein